MVTLPTAVSTISDARGVLRTIIRLTALDAPVLAELAQAALGSESIVECAPSIMLMYRLGLDEQQPYVADLADELLCWIERDLVLAG